MLKFLSRYTDFALLVMRIGIGAMFIVHGFPKMIGGPEKWQKLGEATHYIGIHAAPTTLGFLAAFSELFGGFAMLIGVAYRPACLLLTITMTVAASMHLGKGEGLLGASHALENALFFFAAMCVGPGRYSADRS